MNTTNSCAEPHNLLVVIPDLETGGGERVTRQLIEALSAMGYRIRLASNVPLALRDSLALHSYRHLEWGRRVARFVVIGQELLRCDKNTGVLVVLTGPIIAVGMLNVLFSRKVVAYEHSDLEQLYLLEKPLKRNLRLLALRTSLRSLKCIAVVSTYLSERLPLVLGCTPDRVAIVRNPVQPFLQKLNCRVTIGDMQSLTAYIIGRNSPEKRHFEAIELLAKCSRVGCIVLVAKDVDQLSAQLSSKANAKLRIHTSYADIVCFETSSSFLFSYSAVESYSLVIAEWLASGLTVLSADNEPMRRLWSPWRKCYFVPTQCLLVELEMILTKAIDVGILDVRPNFEPVMLQTTVDDIRRLLDSDLSHY
jgi:glycosyltransferase involved in cell wall biosynthesis